MTPHTARDPAPSITLPMAADGYASVAGRPMGVVAVDDRHDRWPSVSCVVPCRNEAANLAVLLPLLREQLATCSSAWEVVLVDDGSTDETPVLMSTWALEPGIRVLQLSRNFGKEAALTAGLQATRGDVVVMLDADLQHSPALIPQMVARWQAGADVVYAVRESRADEGPLKRMGARGFYRLMNLGDRFEVPAGAGDFRLMGRNAVDALLALPERNRFMKGLYAWVGFRSEALPYTPAERAHGSTNFSLLRLLRLSVDGLTAFTTWPLRAVSIVGTVFALIGFLYGLFIVVDYLIDGNEVSGWTTIIVTLLFFVGVQLISLGILGEYIGRIFEEVKGRPLYVVQRDVGQGLGPRA